MTGDHSHVARFTSLRRLGAACATTAAIATVAVACGADSSNSEPTTAPLSEAAQRGQSIMSTNGCAACHGADWNGGAGPALTGLYNTERTLDDGTVVLADDEYLMTAIAEPTAQVVEGYTLRMPENSLDDAEIADVIEFIKAVGPTDGGSGE